MFVTCWLIIINRVLGAKNKQKKKILTSIIFSSASSSSFSSSSSSSSILIRFATYIHQDQLAYTGLCGHTLKKAINDKRCSCQCVTIIKTNHKFGFHFCILKIRKLSKNLKCFTRNRQLLTLMLIGQRKTMMTK